MKNLQEIWRNLLLKYTEDNFIINKYWEEIISNYSYDNRHYHNLNHITYMMDKAIDLKSIIEDFDTLLFSIFYHDIIYNSTRKDNELKSAVIAKDRMNELNINQPSIDKCYAQIIATKAHENNLDNDTRILLDIDLAILGESQELYINYYKNIRKEYSIYPDFIYNIGRKKVLKHFIGMNQIFKTE